MKFEKIFPIEWQPMVKITITTVDTNLEYEMKMSPSEADALINKLTHEKFVKWEDDEDDTIHYINTRNIIGIDVKNI